MILSIDEICQIISGHETHFYSVLLGNWDSSKPSDQASLDPRILSAEMRLAALRCEYDSLLKKHHEDRERLNNIRSQLRKSYDDLQYLRENESTNSRK